jgi:hypothetical protein
MANRFTSTLSVCRRCHNSQPNAGYQCGELSVRQPDPVVHFLAGDCRHAGGYSGRPDDADREGQARQGVSAGTAAASTKLIPGPGDRARSIDHTCNREVRTRGQLQDVLGLRFSALSTTPGGAAASSTLNTNAQRY